MNELFLASLNPRLPDRLAGIPELAKYECFAADGHWHKAATHDPRHDGKKMAVGHFYSLNLRTHGFRHLAAGEGWHEHDMSALKRAKPKGLRQDVRVRTREGLRLRIICYLDPVTGKSFEFLTNEMDLPPGVLVELYRRRWEVEKVFDEIKN